ncbi:MAG: Gfo/Idh/MocA family oxidoreductase [Bacteroidota bacterium]
MKRRNFTKLAATTTMGTASSPMLWGNSQKWKGANDRINVAVIGIRGMGQAHIKGYQALDNVRVSALCDIDQNLFAPRIKEHFTDKGYDAPKIYGDMRRLFEDQNIDAVSIVTPNHWHALAAIWAIQAGKHVSVEKPCCHNIYEGMKLVEAAKKNTVIVQDGAEQRSNPCGITMAEYLHSGKLGEVYMAKGMCYKWRDTIGRTPDESVPEGVDYDMWLGPAPKRPFSKNRFHYNWHWHWDYGNGDMGNQGVHEVDVARWGLGVKLPTKIHSTGGHMMFDDDQETPNYLISTFEFDSPEGDGDNKKILQFETRHWISNKEGMVANSVEKDNTYMTSSSNTIGNLFYGSKGYMAKNVNRWEAYLGKDRTLAASGEGIGNHYKDFCDAIRAGDQSIAKGDIEEGFYSCALIHLGNISYRLGRSLKFDPNTMKFVNDDEANAMLSRDYRAPYTIPDKV